MNNAARQSPTVAFARELIGAVSEAEKEGRTLFVVATDRALQLLDEPERDECAALILDYVAARRPRAESRAALLGKCFALASPGMELMS